ncbi:MAG: MATE family efflux transporter, partial [Bacillota bacterium]
MKAVPPGSGGRIDATTGSILHSLLRLAWPILTSNVAMVVYGVGQTFWLGRAGADAVAAVAVAMPLMAFFWAVGDGVVMGGAALAARHVGSGDDDEVTRVAGHVVLLTCLYYFLLALVAVPIMQHIVVLIGTPADIVADVALFVRIMLLGMPLTEVFFAYSSLLQGVGNSVTPMKMFTTAMVMNMIIDPFLILGLSPLPLFGVSGAAAGIIAVRAVWALLCLHLLIRGSHGLRLTVSDLRFDPVLLRRL